jgi:hypothetical protein
MNKPIARLPVDDGSLNDEYCSICGDDTVVLTIEGYRDEAQVNLCSCCCAVMKREMNAINDGLNISVK